MKKIVLFCLMASVATAQTKSVKLVRDDANKKVQVLVDNKPFTAYFYPGESVLKKAVLYPVYSPKGTLVTRGWPLDPRAGERVDHPHHVGIWLNYEDANGHDFWNNSNTPPSAKGTYGTIVHTGIKSVKSGAKQGELVVTADWLDKEGKLMLTEETKYIFRGNDNQNIVDRITTLTAADKEVLFKDVKDGFFAIRVARELEHPSDKAEVFTDASGVATKVPKLDNTGITGNYRNTEGVEGEAVWGKRSKWVNLRGKIGEENVNIAIIDHPKNVGYPSYWHARGYGLFAVNPLGQKVFSNGKEELNLKLAPKQSTTFRYRVVVASEGLSDDAMNKLTADFGKL
ncbi:MAG: PmoA family protein [Spirosomataceae bacterium]